MAIEKIQITNKKGKEELPLTDETGKEIVEALRACGGGSQSGGSGGSGGVMLITVTGDSSEPEGITANKTYQEIYDAIQNGIIPFVYNMVDERTVMCQLSMTEEWAYQKAGISFVGNCNFDADHGGTVTMWTIYQIIFKEDGTIKYQEKYFG